MADNFFFSSESVTEGHPDKICDNISDSILDEILKKDKNARVACETLVSSGLVFITGEITTDCYVDVEKIARETIKEIGYNNSDLGFDYKSCAILTSFRNQSSDIARGVNKKDNKIGAGDQGMMFGFACDETEEYMPMGIYLAHKITRRLASLRKEKVLDYLRPDGKAQVTLEYVNNKPVKINKILISAQHEPNIDYDKLKSDIIEQIGLILPKNLVNDELKSKFLINPTGRFVIGGPAGDSGLTGRKIIADTYGGYARHGGGAFSGKDATKVDRCGAYMARYVAKNIVAAGLSNKCEVQVCYAIGIENPVSIYLNLFGNKAEREILDVVKNKFDFRPRAIIERFGLNQGIFKQVCNYGHFGRSDLNLSWEKLDSINLF